MSQNTSHSLQQSLVQSIQVSRNRSRNSASIATGSLGGSSRGIYFKIYNYQLIIPVLVMSMSRSSKLTDLSNFESQPNVSQADEYTTIIEQKQSNDNLNAKWLAFCNNFKSQFAHYFFEVQFCLQQIKILLNLKHFHAITEQLEQIREKVAFITQSIDPSYRYLLVSFLKQVNQLQDLIDSLRPCFGIVKVEAEITEFQLLDAQDQFSFLQETFSKFVMTHFFNGQEDDDDDLQDTGSNSLRQGMSTRGVQIDDDTGSSISSGFSDDNNEVEDFEKTTALDVVGKMKERLLDEDILEASKSHNFILNEDGFVDLKDFFSNTLMLETMSEYEIVCFILHSGLLLKIMNTKNGRVNTRNKDVSQSEILQQFINHLQYTINRILSLNSEQFENILDQNKFDLEHANVGCKRFFSKRNLFRQLMSNVLSSKIARWRQMHLQDEEILQNFSEQLQRLQPAYDKNALRRFCLQFSVPLSKLEIRILAWDKGFHLLQTENQKRITQQIKEHFFTRFQNNILKIHQNPDDLLNLLIDQDKSQTDNLDFKNFFVAIKRAFIPMTPKEIKQLFESECYIQGQITLQGIKVAKLLNITKLIHKIYGVNLVAPNESIITDEYRPEMQSEDKSQTTQKSSSPNNYNQNTLFDRYNEQNTMKLMVKSLQHKNKQLIDQQNQFHVSIQKLQQDIELLHTILKDKDNEIQALNKLVKQQNNSVDEQIRQKGIENIENIKNYANIVDSTQGKVLIREKQWIKERNKYIRDLKLKDIQLDQYRIELEGLVTELKHVKTYRLNSN